MCLCVSVTIHARLLQVGALRTTRFLRVCVYICVDIMFLCVNICLCIRFLLYFGCVYTQTHTRTYTYIHASHHSRHVHIYIHIHTHTSDHSRRTRQRRRQPMPCIRPHISTFIILCILRTSPIRVRPPSTADPSYEHTGVFFQRCAEQRKWSNGSRRLVAFWSYVLGYAVAGLWK